VGNINKQEVWSWIGLYLNLGLMRIIVWSGPKNWVCPFSGHPSLVCMYYNNCKWKSWSDCSGRLCGCGATTRSWSESWGWRDGDSV